MAIELLELSPTLTRSEMIEANRKLNGGNLICENPECKREMTEKEARRDHINNDNSDNSPENLQLICHPCNVKKDHRFSVKNKKKRELGLLRDKRERRHKVNEPIAYGTESQRKNVVGQPKAFRYLIKVLKGLGLSGSVELSSDTVKNAAHNGNVRVPTMLDWIDDKCCPAAYFEYCNNNKSFRFNEKMRKKVFKKELKYCS